MNDTLGRTLHLGLLLVLSADGCQNPNQPGASQRSEPAPRASTVEPQSRDTSSIGDDAQSGRRRPRRGRPQEQAPPGQFDFYLLNLSWSPEFCATHSDSPECGRGLGFVVHGLWPQYANGDYPEQCSNAPGPTNPQADTDIIPTVSLVEHEWQTHGTCSGLAADDYFAAIHKAFAAVKLPSNIGTGNDADGVTPDALLARFAAANPGFTAG